MAEGFSSSRVVLSNNLQGSSEILPKKLGYVYDVILDENNEFAKNKNYNSAIVGAIRFRTSDMMDIEDDNLPFANPSDRNFINLPIVNEAVEIYEFTKGNFLYRRITNTGNPSKTAAEDFIPTYFQTSADASNQTSDYQRVEQTNIPKSNSSNSKKYFGYGKYYKPEENLRKLKLYEGDSLIESRFGQSIRFSAFNNQDKKFYPNIVIRNSQSSKFNNVSVEKTIEEDVNTDGTVISMTSGNHEIGFLPGTVDDKGKSDFQTKPETFADYPSKLIGDQLILNSGRIIFSAKNAEMIFYSKKNYGFISDGALSIDNKLGIDITVGDDINIMTNDRDVNILTGNGSVILGNTELEPMVKGQALVDILEQLIDAITSQIYLTPAGPSASGPTNIADFGTIKSQLNTILSKLNQTS
jgi:hypothetical protein